MIIHSYTYCELAVYVTVTAKPSMLTYFTLFHRNECKAFICIYSFTYVIFHQFENVVGSFGH